MMISCADYIFNSPKEDDSLVVTHDSALDQQTDTLVSRFACPAGTTNLV